MCQSVRGAGEGVSRVGVGPVGVISLWSGWRARSGSCRDRRRDPIFWISGGQPILNSQRPASGCGGGAAV